MWFPHNLSGNVVILVTAHYLDVAQLDVARNPLSTPVNSRGPITEQCVEGGGRALDWTVIACCCTIHKDHRRNLPEAFRLSFRNTKYILYN